MDEKAIRAFYNDKFIRVYQAFGHDVVNDIKQTGTFSGPSFSFTRMTWIKPSFCWMMYRSGWGSKDAGQSNILAIDLTHAGFRWCLAHACLSKRPEYMTAMEFSALKADHPLIVQWDPERDIELNKLPYRAIQIGLRGEAVARYVHEWIVNISNITPQCRHIKTLLDHGQLAEARSLLPLERIYPLNKADYPHIF